MRFLIEQTMMTAQQRVTEIFALEQVPSLRGRARLEVWLSTRSTVRFVALAPFILVLLILKLSVPFSASVWTVLFYSSIAIAMIAFVYALGLFFGLVGVRCPRCGKRFGSAGECAGCGLPRRCE